MPAAAMILIGLRWLHVASLLSLFGTLAFGIWVAPPALRLASGAAPRLRSDLRRLGLWSLGLTLAFGAAWFVQEAATIAGAQGVAETLDVLPVVALQTQFGQVVLARAVLILLAAPLIGRADRLATVLVGLTLALQGAIGHAGATPGPEGTMLVVSEALHLLAAGVWLGALLPLWRALRDLPPLAGARACRRFSPIGMAAVLVLAGTGIVQGVSLIGSFAALFGTEYGQAALVKIGLFGLMVVLAIYNRLTLTDRLAGDHPDQARRRLSLSILAETGLALALVAAAATLASQSPGAHQQALWPFGWRPSLTAMADPDLRQEVAGAFVMIGVGVMAVAASMIWNRGRIVAWVFFLAILINRAPSLELLLVEAYPTSFYTSPTGFDAAAIVKGQALFASHCAACHGKSGAGDGPAAASLHVQPADLTAAHLFDHADGELFWWVTHGMEDPDGGMAMPGFAHQLNDMERWAVIDYVRANNAGEAFQRDHQWPVAVPAPSVAIACAGQKLDVLADLRGQAVEVLADAPGFPGPPPVPPQDGVPVVQLYLSRAAHGTGCHAETPNAWRAFAVLAGLRPDALAGTAFLVDPNGWLRSVRVGGDESGWSDPALLIEEIRQICDHPILKTPGGGHDHH